MSGKEILVDTNIIIYLLAGSDELTDYLQGKNVFISFITELELLGYKSITAEHEAEILAFLSDFSIIQMNNGIKEKYLALTRRHKFKLPDALIAATALAYDMPLISSDIGFNKTPDLSLIMYNPGINLADRRTDK